MRINLRDGGRRESEAQESGHLAELLAVLGEPTRLRIANLLQAQPLCVCDLQSALGLSEPVVSRHLARLRFAHLATATRDGNRMIYRLSWSDSPASSAMKRLLSDIGRQDDWLQRDLDNCRELLSAGRQQKEGGGLAPVSRPNAPAHEEQKPITIEILGPGCVRCLATEQNVRQALSDLRPGLRILHIDEPEQLAKRGIRQTPAVAVEGVVRSWGRVPEVREIRRWLKMRAIKTSNPSSAKPAIPRRATTQSVHAH